MQLSSAEAHSFRRADASAKPNSFTGKGLRLKRRPSATSAAAISKAARIFGWEMAAEVWIAAGNLYVRVHDDAASLRCVQRALQCVAVHSRPFETFTVQVGNECLIYVEVFPRLVSVARISHPASLSSSLLARACCQAIF